MPSKWSPKCEECSFQDTALNYERNEDIGSPVMELNDFGDIGEQFLQTGIVVGPSGDWDCGPKVRSLKELSGLQISHQ